jgi:Holliday junction DNA helicase RuvA
MIGRLRGELVELDGGLAVIDAGGVGYEVSVPDLVATSLPPLGETVSVLIRQIFREDGVSLYGFTDRFQRRLFDLLLSVKGCGPKVGLALIGQVGEDAVASAIISGDARALTRATGVGARLADRIILELKDKMQEETLYRKLEAAQKPRPQAPPEDELVDALLNLGYRRSEAELAASAARETPGEFQDHLRHALRTLQR